MRSPIVVAGLATVSIVVAWGCGTIEDRLGYESTNAPPESFVTSEAGTGADEPELDAGLCVSHDCPPPYITCPGQPGECNVNPGTNLLNCGACGNTCAIPDGGAGAHASMYCINGQCQMQCNYDFGDCNGNSEDGCESYLKGDRANCGICGNSCQDGEICHQGACGCPPGLTLQCGNECRDLRKDPDNCRACGNKCSLPAADEDAGAWPCEPGVSPPNWGPKCSNSSCILGCTGGYENCNGDMCGDGCETKIATDPKNCGGCGIECGPDQFCRDGVCQCGETTIACDFTCIDTLTNALHCGACGRVCPGYKDAINDPLGGTPTCVLGRCNYYCSPGRADCDDNIDNGCEADTMTDPMNCGGCGVHCDIDAGQPCAGGKCLTKPCDPDSGAVF